MKNRYDDFERDYDAYDMRSDGADRFDIWRAKLTQFLRYLSTRQMECWGFFAAGFILAKIF